MAQRWDLSYLLQSSAAVELISTISPEGVRILRHSMAHVMAQAVQELFQDVQIAIDRPLKTDSITISIMTLFYAGRFGEH